MKDYEQLPKPKHDDFIQEMLSWTAQEDFAEQSQAYWARQTMKCQHVENDIQCEQDGTPCYLNPFDPDPNGFYCYEHSHDEGFCPSCNIFWAGVGSFDFSRSGLCPNCQDEIDAEEYDWEIDEDYQYEDYFDEYDELD